MPLTLHFEFGTVQVFENHIVVIMKEGITVKPAHTHNLINIAEKYYKDTYFGYITCRKNSYSVNPLVYLETSKIENLIALAFVSENGLKASNLQVEQIFSKKPLRHFTNLDRAKEWINELIEEKTLKK
ncbi:hypothetical protein [Aequorivita marina]|uniref:hypothetical protein n=1 Tax=Aequorivita marina TaxID=3073654 RepID=UPI0028741DFB|nr:hypothetical protein [Aequorivita sp. S2608]MDS1297751.1 hypothetical protein [Aequorivita sp. S2608]